MHTWLKYRPDGTPKGWWRCLVCGKRRRKRHASKYKVD